MDEAGVISQVWLHATDGLWFAYIMENGGESLSYMKLGDVDKGRSIKNTSGHMCPINSKSNKLLSADDCLADIFKEDIDNTDCFYFINYLLVSDRLKEFVKSRIIKINPSRGALNKTIRRIERDYGFRLLPEFLRSFAELKK